MFKMEFLPPSPLVAKTGHHQLVWKAKYWNLILWTQAHDNGSHLKCCTTGWLRGLSWICICVYIPENLPGFTVELQFLFTSYSCRDFCTEPSQKSHLFLSLAGRWLGLISRCFCYLCVFTSNELSNAVFSTQSRLSKWMECFSSKPLGGRSGITLSVLFGKVHLQEPTFPSFLLVFSFPFECMSSLYTTCSCRRSCVNEEWELALVCKKIKMYCAPYPIISHTEMPFCSSTFYFIFLQILAKIDLGFFSHLFPSSDTVIFPCPRVYIIDLVWFASLWQTFLFQFQLDWLGLAGPFDSWQAPEWLLLSVWYSERQDSVQCFWRGIFVRDTWCSEDFVQLSDFPALRQIKLLTVISVP